MKFLTKIISKRFGDCSPVFANDLAKNGKRRQLLSVPFTSMIGLHNLPIAVRNFVEECSKLCRPDRIYICDGSAKENEMILTLLQRQGTIKLLPKYRNCWLATTDPEDVARVESKTFICTKIKEDAIPTAKEGVKGVLGNWMSYPEMNKCIQDRFPGCMNGRTMYVIPFSMGPIGSPLSKIGIEITDSPYVVASMTIMTRVSDQIWPLIRSEADFVKCLHSVGSPQGKPASKHWPCDPKRTLILHKPEENEIVSYGSGYGGNSLLGKKCFALRIGSTIARKEGWLAEHMLILGITDDCGRKRYIAAAFPSACGKTNLAMMTPSIPGYKVECVGDDIAWMIVDDNGQLRAINPENGFFGVAPGTSSKTNPIAMKTIFENTIFTNVAATSDGGVYWEGMDAELEPNVEITDWRGNRWEENAADKKLAAHANSRFCTPARQCPIIDSDWENPKGVPIDAILFGGRRPEGVPLVYEAFDWNHGVFIGASMRSESTAAAEFTGKTIMHDPFAMRPFFGYNFGHYLQHWLDMKKRTSKLPKIFHVNWFKKGCNGNGKSDFLWPGFGENARVLQWILKRVETGSSDDYGTRTPIGIIPKREHFNFNGLENVDFEQLFEIDKDFWIREIDSIRSYFNDQLPEHLPGDISMQLEQLKARIDNFN